MTRRRNAAPRFIKARYAGKCKETGKDFAANASILYVNGECYCEESRTYQDFASAEFDRVCLNAEY